MDTIEMQWDACKAAAKARDHGARMIRENVLLLDVAEVVENKIRDFGAFPAFPVNIAINNVAAHYTPRIDDPKTFQRGDVVKLDVGAHIEGYIGDTATTVEVGTTRWAQLIRASEEALAKAIDMVAPGISTGDIGRTIENTINSLGYNPVENLTGHGLKRYDLHSDPSVPNIGGSGTLLQEGMTIAIEPFATTGDGYVEGTTGGNIYHFARERPPKGKRALAIYNDIATHHRRLPFASRWITNGDEELLHKMTRWGTISEYHILIEATGGVVSQKEHSLLVTADGCEVMTR